MKKVIKGSAVIRRTYSTGVHWKNRYMPVPPVQTVTKAKQL